MSTNRILCFLGDPEAAAFVRARRRQRAIVKTLEALETAATLPVEYCGPSDDDRDADDAGKVVEFVYPSVTDLLDKGDDAAVKWYFTDLDFHRVPLAEFASLADTVVSGMREFADRVLCAAARMEGGAQ